MRSERSEPALFSVMIVDDEPLAREGLLEAIDRIGLTGIRVAAQCSNALVAIEAIHIERPDILLLDVSMPAVDGFEMLERLEPEMVPPAVVFVTAYDEHAVRAFDAEAIGYVVKPASDEKLRGALVRCVRKVTDARALSAGLPDAPAGSEAPAQHHLTHLIIPETDRRLVIPVDEIDWIEGSTYYVKVHARGRARLLRERLSKLESALDPATFCRSHRSAIVRTSLIREIRQNTPYSYVAVLSTGAAVPVSRERLKGVEGRLGR